MLYFDVYRYFKRMMSMRNAGHALKTIKSMLSMRIAQCCACAILCMRLKYLSHPQHALKIIKSMLSMRLIALGAC